MVIHQVRTSVGWDMHAHSTPMRREQTPERPRGRFEINLYVMKVGKAADGVTSSYDKRGDPRTEFSDLIVAIARDRDREAFARLFAYFAPRIKTLMMQFGAPPARAEEIAQDAMMAVWSKARLFDPAGASASGWIFRIAKNLHLDAIRRDQRFAAIPIDADPDDVALPDAILTLQDTEGRVRAAIAKLSPEQVRVITLSFFEDKPHAEIAKELNIPLGTVKSRVRLAMQRLRVLLDSDQ